MNLRIPPQVGELVAVDAEEGIGCVLQRTD